MGGSRYSPIARIWKSLYDWRVEGEKIFPITRQQRMNTGEKNKPINAHLKSVYKVIILISMTKINTRTVITNIKRQEKDLTTLKKKTKQKQSNLKGT